VATIAAGFAGFGSSSVLCFHTLIIARSRQKVNDFSHIPWIFNTHSSKIVVDSAADVDAALAGFTTHEDSGTGNPPKLNKQKTFANQLKNMTF
jgi:hypothetical protein